MKAKPKRTALLSGVVTVLAMLVPLGSASVASGAGAEAKGPCGLLENSEVRRLISQSGLRALKIQCGLLPKPEAPAEEAKANEPTGEPQVAPKKSRTGLLKERFVVQDTSLGDTDLPLFAADKVVNSRGADAWPNITQSETTVAALGANVMLGWNDSGSVSTTGDFTGYGRSLNGGKTFTDMGAPTTPLGSVSSVSGDPVLFADHPSNHPAGSKPFYFANLGTSTAGVSIISVHKTLNTGTSWASAANASPLATGAEFQDKEWIAVDTLPGFGGSIYTCWRRFGGANGIQFSVSTNQGATFTQMTSNLSTNAVNVQGCYVKADQASGRPTVVWFDQNTSPPTIRSRTCVTFGGGCTSIGNWGAEVIIGNADFAETTVFCQGDATRRVFLDTQTGANTRAIRSLPFPSLASGQSPNISDRFAVWHRAGLASGSGADIAFSKSTDFGATWSAPVRINSTVAGHQFFPSIATNALGHIKVMYYSTQDNASTNRRITVYEVVSTDGGATWSAPVRVSDTLNTFDRPVTNNDGSVPGFPIGNFDTFVISCYMGDYNQVSSAEPGLGVNDFYFSWGDNRLDGNAAMAGVQPDPDVRFDREQGNFACYVRAERVGPSSIEVDWRDLVDGETSWQVFRRLPGANAFTLRATLAPDSQTFTDTTAPLTSLSSVDPYKYQVRALGPAGTITATTVCQS